MAKVFKYVTIEGQKVLALFDPGSTLNWIAEKYVPLYAPIEPLKEELTFSLPKVGEVKVNKYYLLLLDVGVEKNRLPFAVVRKNYNYIFRDFDTRKLTWLNVEAIIGAVTFEILGITIDWSSGEIKKIREAFL